MKKKQVAITKNENTVLREIKKHNLTVNELENTISKLNNANIRYSVYSLFNKGVIKLDDNLHLVPSDSVDVKLVSLSSNSKLVRIDGGVKWRSDEVLGWAFEQLEEFATYGDFESIGIAVRFSDCASYAAFEGEDLTGLAGTVSLLHSSIIDYCRDQD